MPKAAYARGGEGTATTHVIIKEEITSLNILEGKGGGSASRPVQMEKKKG